MQAQHTDLAGQVLTVSAESKSTVSDQKSAVSHRPRLFSSGKRGSKVTILFSLLFVAVVASAFWFVSRGFYQSTENRNRAATGEIPALSIQPSTVASQVASDVNLTVNLDTTTQQIAVTELAITYDPTYLQAISAQVGDMLPATLRPVATDAASGRITAILAKPYAVPPTAASGNGKLLDLRFKALKAGTTQVDFDRTLSRAPLFRGVPSNAIGRYTPASISIANTGGTIDADLYQCLDATASASVVGQSASLGCRVSTEGTARVKLRVTDGMSVQTTAPLTHDVGAGLNQLVTFSYQPATAGDYVAQCQVCVLANGQETSCTDWGYTEPVYKKPVCKWCNGRCAPNDQAHQMCAQGNPQADGKYCAPVSGSCQEQTATNACSQPFVVENPPSDPGAPTGKQTIQTIFKIKGLRSSGVRVNNVEVSARYIDLTTNRIATKTATLAAVSTSSAELTTLTLVQPFTFSNAPLQTKNNRVDILLKTPSSLRKKIGTVVLSSSQSASRDQTYSVTNVESPLLVGDFHPADSNGNNALNIQDVTQIFSKLTGTRVPVTAETKKYDLNYDGAITIQDITLVFSSLTSIRVPGEPL